MHTKARTTKTLLIPCLFLMGVQNLQWYWQFCFYIAMLAEYFFQMASVGNRFPFEFKSTQYVWLFSFIIHIIVYNFYNGLFEREVGTV
jgi:hypothetical protein